MQMQSIGNLNNRQMWAQFLQYLAGAATGYHHYIAYNCWNNHNGKATMLQLQNAFKIKAKIKAQKNGKRM